MSQLQNLELGGNGKGVYKHSADENWLVIFLDWKHGIGWTTSRLHLPHTQ
jgi:hypothetical protein